MSTAKNIILADDHLIFRTGLKSLLQEDKQFVVVGEAKDGRELLQLLRQIKSDLVILDLSMPGMDGIEAIKQIRKKFPRLKVLVLTMQRDPEHLRHAMNSGANGFILKEDTYELLNMAIKMVLKGKTFVSPGMSATVTDRFIREADDITGPSLGLLTKRERQILKLIASGLANKNIASRLNISVRTVENHRVNLTNKLGIKRTANLVKFALSKGLV